MEKRTRLLVVGGVATIIIALVAVVYIAWLNLYSSSQQQVSTEQHIVAQEALSTPTLPSIAQMFEAVNSERVKAGVAPLKLDERLNMSAQRKADDQSKYDYKAHVSPHDGKHGYEYIGDTDISCRTNGENLVWGSEEYANAKASVDGWMGSPEHKMAMLSRAYTLTGFGISLMPDGKTVAVVQHFCEAL